MSTVIKNKSSVVHILINFSIYLRSLFTSRSWLLRKCIKKNFINIEDLIGGIHNGGEIICIAHMQITISIVRHKSDGVSPFTETCRILTVMNKFGNYCIRFFHTLYRKPSDTNI